MTHAVVPSAHPSAAKRLPDARPPRARAPARMRSWGATLYHFWMATQLTNYGGKYSIERMLALEEYIRHTSLARVVFVTLATPIPVAVFVLVQESIPLQDPAAGWSANYGFWIRYAVMAIAIAYGAQMHLSSMVDGTTLTPRQIAYFCSIFTVELTSVAMLVSAYWVFPIPFVTIIFSLVVVVVLIVSFRIVFGGRTFREVAARRDQLLQFNNFSSVQMAMTMVYPVYQVLFQAAANTRWELPVLLLLPIMKIGMKSVFVRTFTHKEDIVPECVVFTVDFFDALYLATCFQSITSVSSIVAIMTVDVLQTTVELHDLYGRTQTILHRFPDSNGTLLSATHAVCQRIETSNKKMYTDVRVHSCTLHRLSEDSKALLDNLEPRISPKASESSLRRSFSRRASDRINSYKLELLNANAIAPKPSTISVHARTTKSNDAVRYPPGDRSRVLHEALEALFTAECLLLTEYLETVIPILYGGFIVAMVHLQSAKYHSEMDGVTHANAMRMVQSIFIYALLELLSFIVLAVIIQRNCRIQALYHLSFVLETQVSPVQCKFILWTVMTLTYRVVHFGTLIKKLICLFTVGSFENLAGVDFSFKFAWMR